MKWYKIKAESYTMEAKKLFDKNYPFNSVVDYLMRHYDLSRERAYKFANDGKWYFERVQKIPRAFTKHYDDYTKKIEEKNLKYFKEKMS